jgi:hypothetical protein
MWVRWDCAVGEITRVVVVVIGLLTWMIGDLKGRMRVYYMAATGNIITPVPAV